MAGKPPEPTCFVCRKHQGLETMPGGPIAESSLGVVSHAGLWGDESEHYLGHLFVEPRKHVPGWPDLTPEEAADLGVQIQIASRALVAVCAAEHVYSFVLGDHIPHLHVHLFGRYPGAPRAYWGTKVDEWPDAPHGDMAAMAALASDLRDHIQGRAP